MIIGNLTYNETSDTYTGTIATMTFHRPIELRPARKTVDKEPDYRVVLILESGTVECGAGWKWTSSKNTEYVSVELDDPTFYAPLSAAIFHDGDSVKCEMHWTRLKRKRRK